MAGRLSPAIFHLAREALARQAAAVYAAAARERARRYDELSARNGGLPTGLATSEPDNPWPNPWI